MTYPLFVVHPREREGDYAQSHVSKGEDYQTRFATVPGRALMWELEKDLLTRMARERGRVHRCLDFACGTGRVVGHVMDVARPVTAVGLDVSESMLDTARNAVSDVAFECADFRDQDWKRFGTFDFITAFRFFANAQPALREDAMRFLSTVLADDGVVILNNHHNFWSLPFLCYRFIGAQHGMYGMTDRQIRKLAHQNALKIVETHAYGIVPQTESVAALPWPLTRAVERLNRRWAASFHWLGYNVIYVLRKESP